MEAGFSQIQSNILQLIDIDSGSKIYYIHLNHAKSNSQVHNKYVAILFLSQNIVHVQSKHWNGIQTQYTWLYYKKVQKQGSFWHSLVYKSLIPTFGIKVKARVSNYIMCQK